MTSRKSTVFMFFGVIIGLSIGIVFRNYRTLELVKKCNSKPNNEESPLKIINLSPKETLRNSQNNLLFVGVMTAKSFLNDRAKAVYETWGKEVPGRIAFFSSEDSHADGLPVVALPGVDDRYPPQKKSFRMLYYMYEHFIDRFEWFARADDDVYINTRKLEKFLRSIDSAKPQFIGQAGRGNSEEFGLLSLEFDENFCMGGPGIIMSQETLKRVAPHIPTCLKNLYSTHEDVEVGRCVQKFAGIPCTWNYEMQSILHHNSSGQNAFTGNLKSKEIHKAISLHPVKRAPLMYRLHSYMQGLYAQEMRQETLSLHRDIAQMKKILTTSSPPSAEGRGLDNDYELDTKMKFEKAELQIFPSNDPKNPKFFGDHEVLGTKPHLNKAQLKSRKDLQTWDFIARSLYSTEQTNPKRKIESAIRESLDDIITEIMDYINNFSRQRGRIIEFRDLLYGYSRTNALYGQDLIFDLLLIYKKYRGKKMTVPVRRHLYIQRAFTDCFVREIADENDDENNGYLSNLKNLPYVLSSKVKNLWQSGIDHISDTLIMPIRNNSIGQYSTTKKLKQRHDTIPTIVFVLSLAGRYQTFLRFLQNYETICLKQPEQYTELLLILFKEHPTDNLSPFINELKKLQQKYPIAEINYVICGGNFSRGIALNMAIHSKYIELDDIIFFVDVDITFNFASIDRIRMNTMKNKQVYLPIVFSEYNPRGWKNESTYITNDYNEFNFNYSKNIEDKLDYNSGYFRQFGFGICAIFKIDILHPSINGFNTDITGWGLEDVKFLEKIVKMNVNSTQLLRSNQRFNLIESTFGITPNPMPEQLSPLILKIFRAPDPSLVHVYHNINCDKKLNESQYSMCLGTKANTIGNFKYLESIFITNKAILNLLRNKNGIS